VARQYIMVKEAIHLIMVREKEREREREREISNILFKGMLPMINFY
jgi:hypothetical protein